MKRITAKKERKKRILKVNNKSASGKKNSQPEWTQDITEHIPSLNNPEWND